LLVDTAQCRNPLNQAFIEAGQQAGYPYTEDTNGYQQEGFGPWDMTAAHGMRSSTAQCYLRPVLGRPNLTVETKAFSRRVLFEGKRAVGIEYERGGRIRTARAVREVIVSTGPINGPPLLFASGIGHGDELKALDVPVVEHLPGVGKNLHDHLEVYMQYECTKPISLTPLFELTGRARVGLEWLLFKSGEGASNQFEAGGFVRVRDDVKHPDLQYHFLPVGIRYDESKPLDFHSFQAHVGPCRPTSRGALTFVSADPKVAPIMQPNYLKTERDRKDFREMIRVTREIFAQKAFDEFRGGEVAPGPEATSDAALDEFVAQSGETAYHPCGTLKMGGDEMAVVDGELKVRGIENLRVVDSSIMPSIISGNLNACTIMIGGSKQRIAATLLCGVYGVDPRTARRAAARRRAQGSTFSRVSISFWRTSMMT
jgi:choline dehydrogenase